MQQLLQANIRLLIYGLLIKPPLCLASTWECWGAGGVSGLHPTLIFGLNSQLWLLTMADQHLILERRRKQNKSSQQGVGEAQVISPVTSFPFNQKPFLSVVTSTHCKYCHKSTKKVRVLSLQYFQI